MVKDVAKTIRNKFKSKSTVDGFFSGASIKIAERYCAKMIMGMLYPRTTENKLTIFIITSLFFLPNMVSIFEFKKFKIDKRPPIYSLSVLVLLFLNLL